MQATDAPWTAPGKLGFDLSAFKNFGSNIDSFAEDFKVCLLVSGPHLFESTQKARATKFFDPAVIPAAWLRHLL